ncbi:hypothetical protein [Pedobacter alpinus]|uniref:Uncharacterized protein n=1 Tax=Pedobacter alpinus TaxID=1590643 RepID=A0ABW5TMF8_9SPHI
MVKPEKYISVNPWPGDLRKYDHKLGNWCYIDKSHPELFLGDQQGAKKYQNIEKRFLRIGQKNGLAKNKPRNSKLS